MLRVFICEDISEHMEAIKKCVGNYILIEELDMEIVCSTDSPSIMLDYLNNNKAAAGIYFLDINLNANIDGILLADAIRKYDPRGFIVFVTAEAEKHLITFKYKIEAMDYIVKGDINFESRICECIHKAYNIYTSKVSNSLQNNFVIDLIRGNTIAMDPSEILYFATLPDKPHNLVTYTKDDKYQFRGSLSKLAKKLDKSFLKCHRSYIVNTKRIVCLNPEDLTITLEEGVVLDIAEKYIKKIKASMK